MSESERERERTEKTAAIPAPSCVSRKEARLCVGNVIARGKMVPRVWSSVVLPSTDRTAHRRILATENATRTDQSRARQSSFGHFRLYSALMSFGWSLAYRVACPVAKIYLLYVYCLYICAYLFIYVLHYLTRTNSTRR